MTAFEDVLEEELDGGQVEVFEAFDADAAFAAGDFAKLREVGLDEGALASVEAHVVLLGGEGAEVAEGGEAVLHGLDCAGGDSLDEDAQGGEGGAAVRGEFVQVFADSGGSNGNGSG